MSMRTRTTIFNAALLRTGNTEVIESEGSEIWRALDANYDEIVRSAFESGDGVYPFGKSRTTLTGRSEGTLGYSDSYALPSDCIHVVEVYIDSYAAADVLEAWELDGDNLVINASNRTIEVEYIRQGAEGEWSALFARGVQFRLEAVIKDAEEESQEAQAKEAEADMQFAKASVKASKNRSQRRAWKSGGGRLIRARRTRDAH